MIPEKVLNAGGYAHPIGPEVCGGLTIRDVFAAHALNGMIAAETDAEGSGAFRVNQETDVPKLRFKAAHAATLAYQLADAMLAARVPQPQAT